MQGDPKSFLEILEQRRSRKIDSVISKNGGDKNCWKIYTRGEGRGEEMKRIFGKQSDTYPTRQRGGTMSRAESNRNKTEIAEWVERNESWRKRNWCRFSRKRGTFCRKWRPVSRGNSLKQQRCWWWRNGALCSRQTSGSRLYCDE